MKAKLDPALTFGYAAWSRAQINEGLVKLASALKLKALRSLAVPDLAPARRG
jgi:hypothetical protein